MRVREKTYISLWTSSLRKEETLNVNLQLIRSRYFFNRAAFPQLDMGPWCPSGRMVIRCKRCRLPSKLQELFGNQLSTVLTFSASIDYQEELCLRWTKPGFSTNYVQCSLLMSQPTLCYFCNFSWALDYFKILKLYTRSLVMLSPSFQIWAPCINIMEGKGLAQGMLTPCTSQNDPADAAEGQSPTSGTYSTTIYFPSHDVATEGGLEAWLWIRVIPDQEDWSRTEGRPHPELWEHHGREGAWPEVPWLFELPPVNDWCHPHSQSTGHSPPAGSRQRKSILPCRDEGARTILPCSLVGLSYQKVYPTMQRQSQDYTLESRCLWAQMGPNTLWSHSLCPFLSTLQLHYCF